MKRVVLFILPLVLVLSNVHAQTCRVSGVVTDASTNEPLVFASVLVQGTQKGTVTDDRGRFSIILPPGDYNLQCSYVGYKMAVVVISVQHDIQLTIALNSLDILLQDMTVFASHEIGGTSQEEVSTLSLQSETIGKTTSMIADVLRSVQMLPGVSNDNELSAKFNVHGGDFNENLVLINGTQVYEPYHVKEASNVSIGIFNVDMIKKMDLMTGGFSARYGDKMSSVLSIEYREGNKDRIMGQASLSLTDADALLEGPIGSSGSFIVGARESYTQFAMKMLGVAQNLHISFNDVQGVLAYRLAPQNKLSLKFIYAGDAFLQDPKTDAGSYYTNSFSNGRVSGSLSQTWGDSSEEHAHYYSGMVALQSTNVISSKALLNSEISYYDELESEHSLHLNVYGFVFNGSGYVNDFYQSVINRLYNSDLRIRTLEINSSYDMQILPSYSTKTGVSYQRIIYNQQQVDQATIWQYTTDYTYPDTINSLRNQNMLDNAFGSINAQSYKVAGYLENIFQISERAILNLGGRFDYFDLNKEMTWSPRVNLAYKISPELTVRGAWGHYYQSPIYQQLEYSTPSDTNTRSQRAIHYVLGADYNIISDIENHNFLKVKVEVFDKIYSDLISATVSSSGRIYYSRKNDAVGRASGLDLYLMYSTTGLSGWISYSYLKAEQKLTLNDTIGYYFPRNTDQRHTLAAVVGFDLGKAWSMNVRVVYGSGYPYTPSVAVYNQSSKVWVWQLQSPNSAHLPAYKRVDARVSKDFGFFRLASSAFLDVSNIFNFKNIWAYNYRFGSNGSPEIEAETLFPMMPTLGIAVKF